MPYLIAEIAQAHDGSLGILHSFIDALADTGVNAIKFQTHIAAAESSDFETFRVPFSYIDKTRFDYWKRMEMTTAQWAEVKAHCKAVGKDFISSPFSNAAVDLLESIGCQTYKVGSGEVSNLLLLERLSQTGRPVLLSSGLSDWQELDTAVAFLQERNVALTLLQCTTAYPSPPAQWGLPLINAIKQRYGLPTGYSDHSGHPAACLAAAALGAEVLEFHAAFDKRMHGPDAKASLVIDEIKWLADALQQVDASLQSSHQKTDISEYATIKTMFGKSLGCNKALPIGHILSFADLESKKPANKGIAAADYQQVLGKKLKTSKEQWAFLNWEDLEND
jgi:N-acetylneuraminate synthase